MKGTKKKWKKKRKQKRKKKQENIVSNILFYFILFIILIQLVIKEKEFLRQQANTSFGKMVLASLKTEPQYSMGKASRPPIYDIIKTPGPIYSQDKLSNIKFNKPPQWKIGTGNRSPLHVGEIFTYFKYPYDKTADISLIPKRWKNIKGGAATLEPRIRYDFIEKNPGPGRYDPKNRSRSQCTTAPSYYLGIKPKGCSIDTPTGTGINVAPWTYKQDNVKTLSQHPNFAKYSFQKAPRKGLEEKVWTKNESYFVYSSFGNQIMTTKTTEPIQSMTKSTRDGQLKRGIFKSMMERQPKPIKIPLPNF